MVAFATEYAPTNEAPDEQNRAREIFLAVEVRAGENGVRSRDPRREKVAFSYETASGPTNFLNRDPINEPGSMLTRDVKKEGDINEELNLYAFVGNDPVNSWDYLGLNAARECTRECRPNVTEQCIRDCMARKARERREANRKRCGALVVRRINTPCAPVPHTYLRDGRGNPHDLPGADGDVDGMWTKEYPIWIPADADCDEFSQCIRDFYAETHISFCYQAVHVAIRECGGTYSLVP